uniref:glycine zipper domain-containing protein n=1 Tax=Paraburkholderia kirstenboschensis TaxID=1245436 RepID=UPI003C72A951
RGLARDADAFRSDAPTAALGTAHAETGAAGSAAYDPRRLQLRKKASARATALNVGRSVISAEAQATHLAAVTLLGASRKAVQADRYVREHPWKSVALAAAAGLAAATIARHNRDDDIAQK